MPLWRLCTWCYMSVLASTPTLVLRHSWLTWSLYFWLWLCIRCSGWGFLPTLDLSPWPLCLLSVFVIFLKFATRENGSEKRRETCPAPFWQSPPLHTSTFQRPDSHPLRSTCQPSPKTSCEGKEHWGAGHRASLARGLSRIMVGTRCMRSLSTAEWKESWIDLDRQGLKARDRE